MEAIGLSASARDFYDRYNSGPKLAFLGLTGGLLFVAVIAISSWRSKDSFFLLLSFVLVPAFLLALPRRIRDLWLAYRGAPALRINELGFWSRHWSSLGWISWRHVESAEIVITSAGTQQLVAHLRAREFALLAGHDQVQVMLTRLGGFLFFIDAGPNAISLLSSREITSSWEDFIATLDPILAANGVPKSERDVPT
jgi:hypothetical protein